MLPSQHRRLEILRHIKKFKALIDVLVNAGVNWNITKETVVNRHKNYVIHGSFNYPGHLVKRLMLLWITYGPIIKTCYDLLFIVSMALGFVRVYNVMCEQFMNASMCC